MPQMIRVALVLCMLAGVAAGEPVRVVLADPDPELLHAVETTLAPWKFDIVIDGIVPATTAEAEERANAQTARFVVWRRQGDLVVFDRERGAAEYRSGKEGPLDETDATAAALTVKTLMRLPPPEDPAAAAAGGPELRFQVGVGSRIAGSDLGARATGAVLVRPWHRYGWRVGIAGDAGTSVNIDSGGFKGTWSDWDVLAIASWTVVRGRWEIEPYLGAGVTRSVLDGNEQAMPRNEAATLGLIRGGAWARWRFDRWSVGGSLGLDVAPGAPAYVKSNGNGQIFAVPGIAFTIGIFAAADLGR